MNRAKLAIGLLLIAGNAWAVSPRIEWEVTLPATGAFTEFVPDSSGGVVVIALDSGGDNVYRLFWLDHTGRVRYSRASQTPVQLVAVCPRGIVLYDDHAQTYIGVDNLGAESPISSTPQVTAPAAPNAVVSRTYDETGFFMQVLVGSEFTIRRYRW